MSSDASLKGICDVGRRDVTDQRALSYFQKVEETSGNLSDALQTLRHAMGKASVS